MASRTRNLIILGLVFALLGASVAAITLKPTRLGLDLAGGISLVYEATGANGGVPSDRELQNAIKVINDRVNSLGVTEAEVQSAGESLIDVSLPDVDDPAQARDLVGSTAKLLFYKWENNVVVGSGRADSRTDSNGATNKGYVKLYEAVRLGSKQKGSTGDADRKNDGIPRPTFYLFDSQQRLLAGPAPTRKDLLDATNEVTKMPLDGKVPPKSEVLTVPRGITIVRTEPVTESRFAKPEYFVLKDNASLTGDDIERATVGTDEAGAPAVDLDFTGAGGDKFHRVTRELRDAGEKEFVLGPKDAASHRFAIVLDGEVVSLASISNTDPSLRDGIAGGRAQITSLTQSEARNVANKVDLGALPVELKLVSQTQVSASLGRQALDEALVAGLIGFALVFLFLLAFYRILGVIAGVALIIYGVLFYAVTKAVGFTYTLPGIAGLVLTLSVAADANIVIFERIKEEVRAGRSIRSSIATGYSKGFATILDANIVTLITAFILFVLATAGVRGFAAALGLGTIVSLFTAVAATSAILGLFSGWRTLERPSALGAGEQKQRWHFDFIGRSKLFFSMSGVILLVTTFAVAGAGLNLGIDFTGGTRIKVATERAATESQVREAFGTVGSSDAKIQRISGDATLGRNAFQIASEELTPDQVQRVEDAIDDRFGIRGIGGERSFDTESVGPTFGAVVARSAIIAIIFSLLVIGGYVSLRFSPKFAVPVLIALAHDMLITVGVYALLDREVTSATVAALLTILGFSLYDTIIVFDRIRENLPRMPRATFSQIVNRSMSEVLTRSLATSFVTALPILALLLFGGETLQDFAFALIVGTISGTYSSVFIASPVLSAWKEREPIFRQRISRIKAENDGVVPPFYVETVGGVATDPAIAERVATDSGAVVDDEQTTPPHGDVAAEESVLSENGSSDSSNGAVTGARPATKAERRAARQRRKHGR